MSFKYNKDTLKENLTIEEVFDLVSELGGEPIMGNGLFTARTICHGGDSHKEETMKICSICGKEMRPGDYYTLKNNHQDNLCKKCRCRGCSDDKPWTYFQIMRYFDIPYIESEWLRLIEKQIKKTISNNEKYKTIFGKYFSLMKLAGYRGYGFNDSS